MLKLGRFLALLAAVMLVIGGAPAVAVGQPCDPCPPDCPMKQQLAVEQAADQGSGPARDGKADNPCLQMLACQTATAAASPYELVGFLQLSAASVTHPMLNPLQAPSRPPDRSLRPPIHI